MNERITRVSILRLDLMHDTGADGYDAVRRSCI